MSRTGKDQPVESVCPHCLKRIPGHIRQKGEQAYLEKTCPEHGFYQTLIWQGEPAFSSWYRPKIPYHGGLRQAKGQGCPNDCGLCEQHSQRTCTALVEVTSRCNLHCPVCFAGSGHSTQGEDLDHATLEQMFATIMEQTGGCNLQLSGGEPTVRDDLPFLVQRAKAAGFDFVQVNSNGIRLAQDSDYVSRLQEAGLSSVFLQFDGLDDQVYRQLRGRDLLHLKKQAVESLSAAGIGVVLVPTVVRGVNTEQLWDIVKFGLEHQPCVRGVHFQPMAYFGRYPHDFQPDHVTLPELMTGLANQSDGVIQQSDFTPPGCEHALCSFSARYLRQEDGHLQRLGKQGSCDCRPSSGLSTSPVSIKSIQPIAAEQGALQSIAVTARQWAGVESGSETGQEQTLDDLDRFLQRARTHTFSISGMAFQDCWSMNLERLQGCCIHVAQPDGRLIPFCSFNLTAIDGRSLHRASSVHDRQADHAIRGEKD